MRVARKPAKELDAGVAGCSRDPHTDMRILMHQNK
jgi:hypothetical protein